MRKMLATLAAVTATLALTAIPAAAASTRNTGSYGPADEPTWVWPLVGAFVLICLVSAWVMTRRPKDL